MVLTILEKLVPLLISLYSVHVAASAVSMNKKIAYRQSLFDRKAQAYEDFMTTFSTLAYDHKNQQKRADLTDAFYRAAIYASHDLKIGMNYFVQHAMTSQTREDIAALDEVTPDLLQKMNKDLQLTWSKNPRNETSAEACAKEQQVPKK